MLKKARLRNIYNPVALSVTGMRAARRGAVIDSLICRPHRDDCSGFVWDKDAIDANSKKMQCYSSDPRTVDL